MSKFVNIGKANQNDPSFRYKMPQMVTRFEGSRTLILNIRDVSKALKCEPSYPTQFFGLELGTQAKFDKAKNRTSINGAHSTQNLAEILDRFIDLFILCPTCGLPEIALSIAPRRLIQVDCAACGHNAGLQSQHKFTAFILKNPPTERDARLKATAASGAASSEMEGAVNTDELPTDVEWSSDISADAVAKRRLEALATWNPREAVLQVLKERQTLEEKKEGMECIPLPLSSLLFTLASCHRDAAAFSDVVEEHQGLFVALGTQAQLLAALSQLFDERAEFARRAVFILNSLYDKEVLQEDAILQWIEWTPDAPHASIIKFADWLKTADEED